jgi:hypothetical protein
MPEGHLLDQAWVSRIHSDRGPSHAGRAELRVGTGERRDEDPDGAWAGALAFPEGVVGRCLLIGFLRLAGQAVVDRPDRAVRHAGSLGNLSHGKT